MSDHRSKTRIGAPNAGIGPDSKTPADWTRGVFNGVTSRMSHGDDANGPNYISATGPRAIELAGEVADVWCYKLGSIQQRSEDCAPTLGGRGQRAGRNPDDVELVLTATTIIHDDQLEAREMARNCASKDSWKSPTPMWLRATGMDTEGLDIPKELWELYPGRAPRRGWEKARKDCALPARRPVGPSSVTSLASRNSQYCARRLKELENSGVGPST